VERFAHPIDPQPAPVRRLRRARRGRHLTTSGRRVRLATVRGPRTRPPSFPDGVLPGNEAPPARRRSPPTCGLPGAVQAPLTGSPRAGERGFTHHVRTAGLWPWIPALRTSRPGMDRLPTSRTVGRYPGTEAPLVLALTEPGWAGLCHARRQLVHPMLGPASRMKLNT
jgi:hypothetical protein